METLEARPAAPPRVLVVDDDKNILKLFRLCLGKHGSDVSVAESVAEAERMLLDGGLSAFDCVVCDYRMTGGNGLDLLAWIKTQDASLATLILTADGEKGVITQALRGGAFDFLEKPVDLSRFIASVEAGATHTRRQRRMTAEAESVRALGVAQHRMLDALGTEGSVQLEVCFHPKLAAGGDFVVQHRVSPDQTLCLLTDVSGHDLEAAYVSAYFQGIVRGMVARGAPITEVYRYFNDLLISEGNQRVKASGRSSTTVSVAACSVLLDSRTQSASIVVCGAPPPVFVDATGRLHALGEQGGAPLGWFEHYTPSQLERSCHAGGWFLLWTDGLSDLAERKGISFWNLAYLLWQVKVSGRSDHLLAQSTDDILLARVGFPSGAGAADFLHPLFVQQYRSAEADRIDEFAEQWRMSLDLAMPDLNDAVRHDVLLSTREAVLNSMKHAGQGKPDALVRLQISYQAERGLFRVWVEDDGPGHDFDHGSHARQAAGDLLPLHRGLLLIHQLAKAVKYERNRATIVMDFSA